MRKKCRFIYELPLLPIDNKTIDEKSAGFVVVKDDKTVAKDIFLHKNPLVESLDSMLTLVESVRQWHS